MPFWKPSHGSQDTKAPGRAASACHSSCPRFLLGDFNEKKKILSLFGIQIKLPPTVSHPSRLAICSLSKPCPFPSPWSCPGKCWVLPQHPLRNRLSLKHVINRRDETPSAQGTSSQRHLHLLCVRKFTLDTAISWARDAHPERVQSVWLKVRQKARLPTGSHSTLFSRFN